MKKLACLLLVVPFLFACKEKPYTGPKMHVEYNESGELIDAVPETMFQKGFTDKVDSIYYIGQDGCSACDKLKPQLSAWCEVNKGAIYYIQVSSITPENEHYISDSTVGYYSWDDRKVTPTVYFLMQGEVVFAGDETNTMSFLMKKVDVVSQN